jgi:hypothetical protein
LAAPVVEKVIQRNLQARVNWKPYFRAARAHRRRLARGDYHRIFCIHLLSPHFITPFEGAPQFTARKKPAIQKAAKAFTINIFARKNTDTFQKGKGCMPRQVCGPRQMRRLTLRLMPYFRFLLRVDLEILSIGLGLILGVYDGVNQPRVLGGGNNAVGIKRFLGIIPFLILIHDIHSRSFIVKAASAAFK